MSVYAKVNKSDLDKIREAMALLKGVAQSCRERSDATTDNQWKKFELGYVQEHIKKEWGMIENYERILAQYEADQPPVYLDEDYIAEQQLGMLTPDAIETVNIPVDEEKMKAELADACERYKNDGEIDSHEGTT